MNRTETQQDEFDSTDQEHVGPGGVVITAHADADVTSGDLRCTQA